MSTEPTPPTNPSESITELPGTVAPPIEAASPPVVVAASPPAWVGWVDYLTLSLLFVLSFFLGSFIATNSDLAMHLAIGERLSAGTHTFGVDPFSWATEAAEGKPAVYWVNHSWLFSWVVYQLFHLLGDAGLVAVKAFVIVAAVGFLSRIGWTESTRWFVLMCLTLSALAMSARFTLQPMVVSLLFLSISLYVLHRAGVFALTDRGSAAEREVYDPRCLWALPPLFTLWANLDYWFILGPLVVGLCWAGTGLSRWFRETGRASAKTLGLVFAVGLAACVLNPFHVRVFQLPPELAYLVVALTDPAGLALPDALVAAGRTLSELRKAQADSSMTMSPVTVEYWKNDRFGWNIAAIALLPLLILGFGGFTLMALVKQQANAPSLHVGRFLIWLVFGVMALALYRMIPFFALVAAPLTALTLGEFLRWQQEVGAVTSERRDRGLNLARALSVPFLLLLLALAWPGMLYVVIDGYAPRHVDWGVRFDPSLERAAATLEDLKDANECRNVFNIGFDVGNTLPWYAPGVKHALDTRFALFSREVGAYVKARQALLYKDRPDADWQDWFEKHNVDQVVVVANFLQLKEHARWWWSEGNREWTEELRWRQRYGDNRTMVFSWAGKQRWPAGTALHDWNSQAFGVVPERLRSPAGGTLPVPPPESLWAQLTATTGPQPPEVGEAAILKRQYDLYNLMTHPPLMLQLVREKDRIIVPHRQLMLLSLYVHAGMDTTAHGAAANIHLIRPGDYSAPALPILMTRAARRAVAANPTDARCHLALLDAIETLRNHEAYATSELGTSQVREPLRQLQILTSLYQAARLRPDDYSLQKGLYESYLNANLFDVALEQMQAAQKALEAIKASGRANPREIEAALKNHHELQAAVEQKVKERLAKWRDLSQGKSHLERAGMAFGEKYTEFFGERQVKTNLGLAKTALDLMQSMPKGSLKPGEEAVFITLNFELWLRIGRADLIALDLKDESIRKALPPLHLAKYQMFASAAIGDYASSDAAAAVLQEQLRANWRERRLQSAAAIMIAPAIYTGPEFTFALAGPSAIRMGLINEQRQELCNMIAMRGILALEAGDTKKARDFFQDAMNEAGELYYYADRSLVRRYLDLLNAQRP